MTWVLVIFVLTEAGNYNGGVSSSMQRVEFTTEKLCQAARDRINDINFPRRTEIRTSCIKTK